MDLQDETNVKASCSVGVLLGSRGSVICGQAEQFRKISIYF